MKPTSNKIYILFIQMKIIAILLVLVTGSLAMHAHHPIQHLLSMSNSHMQPSTANPAFDDEFAGMKALADSLNKALTSKDAKKYQFLITKTSQIQAGLNKLQSTLQRFNLTATSTSQLCPGVTTFNRTELRRYITYTEEKIKISTEYLSTCVDCSFVSDDFLKIQNLTNLYISNLNKTMDGNYCNRDKTRSEIPSGIVNLNSSYFKNNLNAKNWYYGSTTASDYKIYIFKRSSTYNLTNCPLKTPFVKDDVQVCFDCPEGSVFNLGEQKCDTCQPNQILNMQSGKCDKCLGEKKFINGLLTCRLCILAQGELFNSTNGKCYRCGSDSYLDTDKLACIKIDCDPSTPRFNNATHKCQACGVSEIIDPQNITRCIKTNYIGLCPPATPLYDAKTKQCVACPSNTKYNKDKNQCETLTSPNHFSTSTHQTAPTNLNYHLAETTTLTIICPQGFTLYQETKLCVKTICGPTQTVNRTSSSCVETSSTCRANQVYVLKVNRCLPKSIICNDHQYYNPEIQNCITIQSNCTKDQYYDRLYHKCMQKKQKCKGNQYYNEELHICQKMILCKMDEEFNFKFRICQKKRLKCDKQLQYFDEYLLKCSQYTFITSPYSFNLIYRDDFTNLINLYKNEKGSTANIKDCPLKTPFYQKSSMKCIKCENSTPYFDIDRDICVTCPQKQIYNPSKHRCQTIDLSSISSSIGKIRV